MAKLNEQMDALTRLSHEELLAAASALDELLEQAQPAGIQLLQDGQEAEAESLIRQAEALAVSGERFRPAASLRAMLGNLDESRNDFDGALAWYGAVLELPVADGDEQAHSARLFALGRISEIYDNLDDDNQFVTTLSQLFNEAVDAGRADYAFPTAAQLAWTYINHHKLDAGVYFLDLAHRYWTAMTQQAIESEWRENFANLLAGCARALFYEKKDYPGALLWAKRALDIDPVSADGLRIRGFAYTELEELDQAADAFRAWVVAEPENATARNNLAEILSNLGDEGAVETLAEAVRLDPGNLQFRLNLARSLRRFERLDEAVAELDALISMGYERERTEPPADSARQFRDSADYQKNTPLADLVDFGLSLRATINTERDRRDLLVHDIGALLDRPDPFTKALGYWRRGQVFEKDNDAEGAVAAYQDAIATGRAAADVYADCAELLLRLGRDAAALEALEMLAQRGRDPERAITGLTELLDRHPGDPDILRARGEANFHAWHANAARADLKAAIEAGEPGWRAYRMLGLSLILFSPTDDDQESQISIPGAIDALTEAALRAAGTSDPDAADATRNLMWLLDRAFGNTEWLTFLSLLAASGAEMPWRSTLPALTPALLAWGRTVEVDEAQDWSATVAGWEETQELFASAGFPVTAARTSLNIADVQLRLYDLDVVAANLEIAETVILLTGRPMTEGLDEDHTAAGVVGIEIDYMPVYGIGITEYQNMMRLIRIQLAARSGDYEAALDGIADTEWLFARPGTADLAPAVSMSGIAGIAQILRQASEQPLAAKLLERISAVSPESFSAQMWATLSTLRVGDFDAQMGYLDRAEQVAQDRPEELQMLTVMKAEANIRHEKWPEALALLDSVQGKKFSSPNTELGIDVIRAEAELGQGNPTEALAIADRAVNRLEEARQDLTRWDLREAWSGRSVHPYSVAIQAAMVAGRPSLAFEYAERSRARAFLDDVSVDEAEVRELATLLRQSRDNIAWLEQLPAELSPAEMTRLQTLITRYPSDLPRQAPDDSVNRERGDLNRILRRDQAELARRLDSAKVAALQRTGFAPVTWPQLRSAIGPVHLAQYHLVGHRVLLFTGAEAEPEIVEIQVDLDSIQRLLAEGETAGGGYDLRRVDLESVQSAAAPLVAPLGSRVPPGALICLVPHGQLHAIPLHILEVNGEPLGLRNPVSYWPSASILAGHLARETATSPGNTLVVGDPGGDLDYARVEAIAVARQLAVAPLLGNQVTKRLVLDTLLDPATPLALIHIAAHGTLDTGGQGVGIVLGPSSGNDGHWLRDDVVTQQDLDDAALPAALVVLSCCRTADSTLRPGDELTGLARVFLTAGAGAVVLSQWSVDDLSTSLLMRELYRLIADRGLDGNVQTLADALRQAARFTRSLSRGDVTAAIQAGLADALKDARTKRTVMVDSAALAPTTGFPPLRAALAVSEEKTLRDAALQAEARRRELHTDENDEYPFWHPHYWAPFVLVGDWRLPQSLKLARLP